MSIKPLRTLKTPNNTYIVADKATLDGNILKFWKTLTSPETSDTLVYSVDLSSLQISIDVDGTLTISGSAADAKIVGDKLKTIETELLKKIESTDIPDSLPNPNALSITVNGVTETYDGTEVKNIVIEAAAPDTTLTESGKAADSKTVGDKFNTVESNMSTLESKVNANSSQTAANTENITGLGTEIDALKAAVKKVENIQQYEYDVSYDESDGTFSLIENDVVKTQLTIKGGGGGGSSSGVTITIDRLNGDIIDCLLGDSAIIKFNFSSVDSSGDSTGAETGTWYVGSTKVATQTLTQGENQFDIGPYLSSGTNNIRLSVSVDSSISTKKWTVNATNMYLEFDVDDSQPISGDFYFRHTPYGDLQKTIHFLIDGTTEITYTTSESGRQQSQVIHEQTHGSHKILVWATATVNDTEISTEKYVFDLMWIADGETAPVITSSVPDPVVTKQYTAVNIPYVVYTPGSLTSEVTLAVDGVDVSTMEVGRTKQIWAYKSSAIGSKVLTITCGDTVKTINVTVEELGYDIQPVTANLQFDFNPTSMAGNSDLRAFTSNGHGISFSDNFDWENGGLQLDADGIQAFVVKAGTTATLDYNLFADDARKTGKNFKFIYKSTNVRNYDASVASCYSNGIGIQYNAQQATLTSEQTTLVTPYCEDTYMETEFDIQSDSKNFREMTAWCDGKPNRVAIYSANDNFTQSAAVPFTIGYADCDVWVYRFKAYNASLTDDEHLDNFIADAPDGEEMVSRYERNQIVNASGEIDPDILADVCPDLRVVILTCPRFTTGKKDKVSGCTLQHIYKNGRPEDNWIAYDMVHSGQGTSSEYYGDSSRNLDFNCKNGFDLEDGTHMELYSMTPNSVGVNYFNNKVNVASSENANNACMQDDYHVFQPYIRPARAANPMVRDTMEFHPDVIFVKDESGELFGDTKVHFYSCGDFGNSKKNAAAMAHGLTNPELECVIEQLNNTSDLSRFKSADFSNELYDGEGSFEFRYPSEPTDTMKANWEAFCRWVNSTDTTQATGNALSSSVTYDGVTYTKDTAEYRRAKFVNEFDNHCISNSLTYHYLFTERHTMVDNRAKNVFWGTEDGIHWHVLFDYDNDTADGNDNEGGLTLTYGLEDTDTIGTKNVFNGADSVIWCNIRDFMFDRLQKMFIDRESAGAWDAKRIIKKFEDYQNVKPERLIIADMRRKYLRPYEESGTTSYLPMLYGDKQHQRRQFETYQERYMSSKYLGSVCTSDVITMRGYTPTNWAGVKPESKMKITPYADMYVALKAGSVTSKVRAKRGVEYEMDFSAIGALNDTEIYPYSASMIQKIGDLSCLYVGYCNFSAATKLETILIGSNVDGYSNSNMTEFSIGNNVMLKELNLQNLPNLKQSIDVTGCVALKTFLANGSGITGVAFANGGIIETAHLPAPASVTLRNLNHLSDFTLESYEKLTTIRLENCPTIDSLDFITKAVNLSRVRALGLDWTLQDTTVLDRLLGLQGMDENEYNTEVSVLSGQAYVPTMRQSKLDAYNAAWEDLEVSYSTLIANYKVTFVNWDGTVLYETFVDRGDNAIDPVTAGYIDTPTREMDAQYTYEYAGWDDSLNAITGNRTITATYTPVLRTFTVRWYAEIGVPIGDAVTVNYGESAIYTGDLPTKTDGESSYIFNLFDRWNINTGYITEDTNVFAVWQTGELPPAGTDLSDMTPVEIYAVSKADKVADYFTLKDSVDIQMGFDVSYGNITEHVLAEELILDGSTCVDTGIKLFDTDKAWVLAMDYEFADTTNGQVMLNCFDEDGHDGVQLRYNNAPQVRYGTTSQSVASGKNREMCVIRKKKDSNILYIYASNCYSDSIAVAALDRTRTTVTESTLVLGAQKAIDGVLSNYAKGKIHWCKLWDADLGDGDCEKLVNWTRETYTFEYCGNRRYKLAGQSNKYAPASFICKSLMLRTHQMNTSGINIGGWDASYMRQWIQKRVYNAFPEIWRQIFQKVLVNATAGNKSSDIITSEDYIYLPCVVEFSGTTETPWIQEGSHITWFTSNRLRAKFRGVNVPDGATFFTSSTDPSLVSSNNVKVGDVWVNQNESTRCYIRMADGTWFGANYFWLRGASVSFSAYFSIVNYSGYVGTGANYASYSYGVCPCFSI